MLKKFKIEFNKIITYSVVIEAENEVLAEYSFLNEDLPPVNAIKTDCESFEIIKIEETNF